MWGELMRIAICDDELKIRKETKDALNNYFSEKLIEFEIYDFANGEDLLNSKIDFVNSYFSFIFSRK